MKRLIAVLVCLMMLLSLCPAIYAEAVDESEAESIGRTGADADTDDLDEQGFYTSMSDDADFGDPGKLDLYTSMSADDIVSTWDELDTWLENNRDRGGTVYLGDNIIVSGESDDSGVFSIYGSNWDSVRVTIEAGQYGITVTGSLGIGDKVDIRGDGNINPVINVCGGGRLVTRSSSYDHAPVITATGSGGIALKLESGAEYYNSYTEMFMKYQATGEASIAIYSEIELDILDHYIEAAGAGARGIVSTEPVSLFLSIISAKGAAITAPGVILDTCAVSPECADAQVINRKATRFTGRFPIQTAVAVAAGDEMNGFYSEGFMLFIYLSATCIDDEKVIACYIGFDDTGVNYNSPGTYSIPLMSLPPPYDAFNLISDENPLFLDIEIIDYSIPVLFDMWYSWWGYYCIEHDYSGSEDLTLWISYDDGESWSVFWQQSDDSYDDDSIFEVEIYSDYNQIALYIYDEAMIDPDDPPVLFVYEVGVGKGSAAFYVNAFEIENGNWGGDRTGGDRYQNPWNVIIGGNEGDESGNDQTSADSGGDGSGDKQSDPQQGGIDTEAELSGTPEPVQNTSAAEANDYEADSMSQAPASHADNSEPTDTPQTGTLILEPTNPVAVAGTDAANDGEDTHRGHTGANSIARGPAIVPDSGLIFDLDGSGSPMEIRNDFPLAEVRAPIVPPIPLPNPVLEVTTLTEIMEHTAPFIGLPFVMSIVGVGCLAAFLTFFLRQRNVLAGR